MGSKKCNQMGQTQHPAIWLSGKLCGVRYGTLWLSHNSFSVTATGYLYSFVFQWTLIPLLALKLPTYLPTLLLTCSCPSEYRNTTLPCFPQVTLLYALGQWIDFRNMVRLAAENSTSEIYHEKQLLGLIRNQVFIENSESYSLLV